MFINLLAFVTAIFRLQESSLHSGKERLSLFSHSLEEELVLGAVLHKQRVAVLKVVQFIGDY